MEENRVVIRMKNGEVIKGYMSHNELELFQKNGVGRCNLINHPNTIAVYVTPSQVSGLFLVDDFTGNIPPRYSKLLHSIQAIISKNFPLITSSIVVAFLSIVGLLFLL